MLALAGLAVAAADLLQTRRPPCWEAPAVLAWGLVLTWLAGVYAMVAAYDGNGGHTHPRYLFPALAVLAVLGAAGLDRLPGASPSTPPPATCGSATLARTPTRRSTSSRPGRVAATTAGTGARAATPTTAGSGPRGSSTR
jgi:hypothetical protein